MIGIDAVLYDEVGFDIAFTAEGDIETADQLDTAVKMSLFCERRATPSEMPVPELRRGWIGNEATPGFEIGSKVWLYEQARMTQTILNGLEAAAANGLDWLVDDAIAVKLETSITPTELLITAYRPNSEVATFYYNLWEGTGA